MLQFLYILGFLILPVSESWAHGGQYKSSCASLCNPQTLSPGLSGRSLSYDMKKGPTSYDHYSEWELTHASEWVAQRCRYFEAQVNYRDAVYCKPPCCECQLTSTSQYCCGDMTLDKCRVPEWGLPKRPLVASVPVPPPRGWLPTHCLKYTADSNKYIYNDHLNCAGPCCRCWATKVKDIEIRYCCGEVLPGRLYRYMCQEPFFGGSYGYDYAYIGGYDAGERPEITGPEPVVTPRPPPTTTTSRPATTRRRIATPPPKFRPKTGRSFHVFG